jgi:hypothetical protein
MFKQHKRMAMLQVTIAILLVASICAVCLQLGQKALAQNATTNRTGEAAGPQQLTTKGPLSLTNASKSPSAVGGGNITSPGTSGTAGAKNITAGMPG